MTPLEIVLIIVIVFIIMTIVALIRYSIDLSWENYGLTLKVDDNDWIKIESVEDLPKESGFFYIVVNDLVINAPCYFNSITKRWWIDCEQYPTHYQAIFEPQPPIY
jgi:ABC-type polysaccharide transport system permease subunit